jgi:hypothetical protein
MVVDASGNVYVTGSSLDEAVTFDYATIKHDSTGQEQWVGRYNGLGNDTDVATTIAVDASGNVYVTGVRAGSGTNTDYGTIKYNSFGLEQ